MREKVSVIMAVKHPSPHLNQALVSVAVQSQQPFEVILVETGPVTTGMPWSDLPELRRIAQQGEGLADAWNQGAEAASGNFLAWLDSDDTWTPNALQSHVSALAATPAAMASVGRVRFIREGAHLPPSFRPSLLYGDHLAYMPGSALVTRAAWDRVGPYREDLGVATDIEWFARLRRAVPVIPLPHHVLNKRVHAGNLSYEAAQQGDYNGDLLRALRAHIAAGGERP